MSDPTQVQQQRRETIIAVTAAALAGLLTAKVAEIQVDLLGRFAKLIARYGLGDLLLFSMRKASRAAADRLIRETQQLAVQVVDRAVAEGAKAAGGSGGGPGGAVPPAFPGGDSWESHAQRSARAIREDLQGKLNLLGYRITRYADDVYGAVTADAARAQVLGLTPAQAQHEAYRKLVREGITGYVDSKGRNWELSAYVEMATRTAAERAFNVSHLDRMQSLGLDLFTVPDDGHPCPLCQPWQGKILSIAPDSRADATVAEATAAGLFHPRCRHVLVGYVPGVTEIPPAPSPWSEEDHARYLESQTQRRLEREIRAAKREEAAAFTPEMRSQAQFAVRRAQARMRDFIEQTGRVRNRRREQLDLGARA
jgi:hypothetical protein